MTLVLHAIETPPVALRPILQKPNFRQWQDELNLLEQEVKFYRHLLKMGVSNCGVRRKSLMFDLLNDFSNIEDNDLPAFRLELALISEIRNSEQSSAHAFFQKKERIISSVKALKSSVFPLVFELQKLSIC